MPSSERILAEAKRKGKLPMKLDTLPPMTAISIVGLAQVLSGAIQDGRLNCQKAVDMATPSSDPLLTAEAVMALAQALIKSGDNAAALKASLDAQQTFARLGKPDYEWLAFLFAALARKGSGDTEQAREYASQAKTLLVGLQQRWGDANYQSYLSPPDIQFHHNQLNELPPKP